MREFVMIAAVALGCAASPVDVNETAEPVRMAENGGGDGVCTAGNYCVFTWPGTHDQYVTTCAPNPNGSLVCCGGCIDANGICQDGGADMVCGALGSSCTSCARGTGCDPAHHECEALCNLPDGSPCIGIGDVGGTCHGGYCY